MADSGNPKRAIIVWKDGNPYTEYVDAVTKKNMEDLHWIALSMPYVGKKRKRAIGEDEDGETIYEETDEFLNEFEKAMDGRRTLEVIAMRKVKDAAEGSHDMIKYVEDRALGKPTQTQHNLQVTGTLQDFFNEIRVLDETDPMRDPPDKEPVMLHMTDNYEVIEVDEYDRDAILKDPLAGF